MANAAYTLITGASKGFGRAWALECAQRRINLILIALPGSELPAFDERTRTKFGVEVISIEKDLCQPYCCQEIYQQIRASGAQVNVLVNNAGIGSTTHFEEGSLA